ncbi:MAG: FAD-binding protein [Streptosporangiales bacterium]|nr:FAD-binding protein [Streptosporangiales bacterium]
MTEEGVDLVVAGAGGGLVAALRAAERGLSVLVVEADEHFRRGNNTAMSTAMVPGAGTRWQAAVGIGDSPGRLVADIVAKTNGEADERLARVLAGVSAELVTWLADGLGLPIELVTDFPYPGHSAYRCHTIPGRSGRALLDHLARRVAGDDAIELLTPARLVEVLPGPAAVVAYPDGRREEIGCRAVLLATGGYGADPELVRRHIPEIANATYHGGEHARGDALRIGGSLGAATAYLDAYQGHAAVTLPAGTLVGWATIMHGAVMVNARGERFGDETCGYSEYAAMLAAQPNSHGWIVLDRRIHDACLPFQDFRDTVESGALSWADDVAGLASAARLDAERLAATLADADAAARGRRTDPFGRTGWEAPLAPPYAVVRVHPCLFHTQGGLVVDGNARVLGPDGDPIPGLYASGGAAMSISGHGAAGYLAGNGLLPALGLAFLAADHVARPLPAVILQKFKSGRI